MRHVALILVGPVAFALAACNPFASNSGTSDADLPKATEVSSQPAAAATTTAGATDSAGGKTASDASTSTRVAANAGVTDTKGSSRAASDQCNDSNDRNVVVVNDTRTTLRELYGSNVNRTDWEEDVLGSRVLGAGEQINVNWDDGSCACDFDLKAVFTDGTETVRRTFNVCREAQWRIVD